MVDVKDNGKYREKFSFSEFRSQMLLPMKIRLKFILLITSIISTTALVSTEYESNRCVVGGDYMEKTSSGAKIINDPDKQSLQDVGNKTCGFKLTGNMNSTTCSDDIKITFVAVEVKTMSGEFCSFWSDHAICVCDFFGCNSVTGAFYDLLLKSFTGTGEIVGENYNSTTFLKEQLYTDNITECIVDSLEMVYNAKKLYPNPERVQEMKEAGWNQQSSTSAKSSFPWVPVLIAVGVLFSIAVSIVVVFIVKRKGSGAQNKRKEKEETLKQGLKPGARQYVDDLNKEANLLEFWYKTFAKLSEDYKRKEFTFTEIAEDDLDNRKQLECIDTTRVDFDEERFVNANSVQLINEREIIAFQPPLKHTTESMWRMILFKKCSVVVMMCQMKEGKETVCSQYFPEDSGGVLTFGEVKVSCRESLTLARYGYAHRKLQVEITGQVTRTVHHYQYLPWVEGKTPPEPSQIVSLIRAMEPFHGRDGLLAVHCSNGLGRTGAFVGLYEAMAILEKGFILNAEDVVNRLRESRYWIVEKKEHYVVMNVLLVELLADKGLVSRTEPFYRKVMDAWTKFKKVTYVG